MALVVQYFTDYNTNKRMRYVTTRVETTKENCTVCQRINSFIDLVNNKEVPRQMIGLATGNLARHLKTKKHWKIINEYTEEMK